MKNNVRNRWRPQTEFDQLCDREDRIFASNGGVISVEFDKVIYPNGDIEDRLATKKRRDLFI